jgi:hypothetical protein
VIVDVKKAIIIITIAEMILTGVPKSKAKYGKVKAKFIASIDIILDMIPYKYPSVNNEMRKTANTNSVVICSSTLKTF